MESCDNFMLEIKLERAFKPRVEKLLAQIKKKFLKKSKKKFPPEYKLKAMDKNGFSDPFVKFVMDGKELCKSDTKKKNLNPVWNQNFAIKIPAQRGKLVVEVYDHDVIGSNDLIGCTSLDLGPLLLEETSRNVLKLRESLSKPENEKLGTLQFTLRVAPFDESGRGLLSANHRAVFSLRVIYRRIRKVTFPTWVTFILALSWCRKPK